MPQISGIQPRMLPAETPTKHRAIVGLCVFKEIRDKRPYYTHAGLFEVCTSLAAVLRELYLEDLLI